MLTSGDVQFEPSTGAKILGLTSSLFMMTAGDSGLQAEIFYLLYREITERITRAPNNWVLIGDAADLYVSYYNAIRKKRAENAILRPLYLDENSYVTNQQGLNERLVSDISRELLNFVMPNISAIIAGIDPTGAHIYLIDRGRTNALETTCLDAVGFVAIGSGGRHASSQFMFARHAWNAPLADTLFLSYYAKRKSEVAPGVGQGTDMVVVGPGLGTFTVLNATVVEKLETEYKKVVKAEDRGFASAKVEIKGYVETLQRQAQTAAAGAQQQPPPPATNGGAAPVDEPTTK
jgi:hypothetical protein